MTLSPVARNRLEMALRNNGYHIECDVGDDWLAADATFAPGRCFLAYRQIGGEEVIVATSLGHVARALVEEGCASLHNIVLPAGVVAVFSTDLAGLHSTVRRVFELSRSLPSAPLDRFQDKTRPLPSTTEAERLVVQRMGQDIFREALVDFWAGRCAISGLDQIELLRASHMKPWADCATDAERLDPYNGLLLGAHWDAAFDRGLITFEDDGTLRLSNRLLPKARTLLVPDPSLAMPFVSNLRVAHLPYLKYHRENVWRV